MADAIRGPMIHSVQFRNGRRRLYVTVAYAREGEIVPNSNTVSLTDKVAVVTGGGGGIGKSISQTFAAHGARIAVVDWDEQRATETAGEIEASGGQALSLVVDVQQREQVARMTEATLARFGRIDILVNNVGDHLKLRKPLYRELGTEWGAHYKINLAHVFYCCHAIVPKIIDQGDGGSIINISTIEAFRGAARPLRLFGLQRCHNELHQEPGPGACPNGIRVNAIAPETTETPQVRPRVMIPEESQWMIPHWIPMGRYGTPDDAAGCALFLASNLSSWVTGTTVHMDGGAMAAGGFFRSAANEWSTRPCVEHSPVLRR